MLGLGAKHWVFLALALALGYRYSSRRTTSYWDTVERWSEEEVDFLTPQPMDQSMLFKTVEEIPTPIQVRAGTGAGAGEGVKATPLQVPAQGKVPAWLAGSLVRDGPGLFEFGEETAQHSFDGMAMLRRYQVGAMEQGVGMNYSRRLVDSNILRDNRREQRFTKFGVGTPAAGNAGVNGERTGTV